MARVVKSCQVCSKQTETFDDNDMSATSLYAATPAQHSILSVPVLAKTRVSLFADTEGHFDTGHCLLFSRVCLPSFIFLPPSDLLEGIIGQINKENMTHTYY